MKTRSLFNILPEFPRTPHVYWKPNITGEDIIATDNESNIILTSNRVSITEKVDGSNCGMSFYENQPIIRNRNHILNKGLVKNTPAKKQFASVWGWFYENKEKFKLLNEIGPYSVYGEWCLAQHGLEYDNLPSYFLAYDLFNYESQIFEATDVARKILNEVGFHLVPELYFGKIEQDFNYLEKISNQPSELTSKGNREGIYFRINNHIEVTHRFKMVRSDFVQGALWNEEKLIKNKVR